jgi:hypothetical protein
VKAPTAILLVVLLAVPSLAQNSQATVQTSGADPVERKARYPSPNGSLVAVIKTVNRSESELSIRAPSGELLFQKSYVSKDGEHGFGVVKAQWTPDSQYFLYSLASTGGHQPWHSPVDFFDRRRFQVRSLDTVLKDSIVNPQFVVAAPDKVKVALNLAGKSVRVSLFSFPPPGSPNSCQGSQTVRITDVAMNKYVEHIEMEPDRLGHHLNIEGVAILDITFGRDGKVIKAKAVSGNPIALARLMDAVPKWRFKPVIIQREPVSGCGSLHVQYSITDGVPSARPEDTSD